jgi:hypothetical protein
MQYHRHIGLYLPGGHAAQQLLGILLMFGRQDKGMGRRRGGHERESVRAPRHLRQNGRHTS